METSVCKKRTLKTPKDKKAKKPKNDEFVVDLFSQIFLLSNFPVDFDKIQYEDFNAYLVFKHGSRSIYLPIKTIVKDSQRVIDFSFLNFDFRYYRCFLSPEQEACSHITCGEIQSIIGEIGIAAFYKEKVEQILKCDKRNNESDMVEEESNLLLTRDYLNVRIGISFPIYCLNGDLILTRPYSPGIYTEKTNIYVEDTKVFEEEEFSYESNLVSILSLSRDNITFQINAALSDILFPKFTVATFNHTPKTAGQNTITQNNNPILGVTLEDFKNSVWPPRQETERFLKAFLSWLGFGVFEVTRNDEIRFLHRKLKHQEPLPGSVDLKEWTKKEASAIHAEYDRSKTFFFASPFNIEDTKVIMDQLESFSSMPNKRTDFLAFSFEMVEENLFQDKIVIIKDVNVRITLDFDEQVNKKNYTPILIKPNGLWSTQLENIYKNFEKYGGSQIIKFKFFKSIPDEIFNAYYPNCLSRPYGKEWQSYMWSAPILLIWVNRRYISARRAALDARKESELPWTKNIIHCPENDEELKMNTKIFKKFI